MNIKRFMTNSSVLFLADEGAVQHIVYHRGAVLSANSAPFQLVNCIG
jgi:hypothetical protein